MILAIDPGTTESAYLFLCSWGIDGFGKVSNDEMLAVIHEHRFKDSAQNLIIEEVRSYGMPIGQTTLETVKWSGRFWGCGLQAGYEVIWAGRKEIVTALCGSARAKDANVRQALIDIYGEPGTKKRPGKTYGITADVWSALAIAHHALTIAK